MYCSLHYRLLLCTCALTALLWRCAHSGYEPTTTQHTPVLYNDSSNPIYLFPDSSPDSCQLPADISYFISELNFEAQDGRILIGAANKLYLLDETNLNCLSEFEWNATESNVDSCSTDNTGSDQMSTCQNHIRVYKLIPGTDNLALVCGTQASISPKCRMVRISGGVSLMPIMDPVDAADAIVSYYPEFAGFGEFNDLGSGTSYFGVGFFQGDRGVGRDYQMAFYDVSTSPVLSVTQSIATVVSEAWLKSPVTFIDYYRADYAPPTLEALQAGGIFGVNPRPDDYKFYFVFIRENTAASGTEVIYSQVVRICRNDPGVNGHFSTYEKARIYCMIEVPPGREFIGANDYIYNNIDSVAFNEEGRYGENEDYIKSMYGAFSGPRIGPEGTAICVYPAYNSRETDSTAMFNRGIFDIFREDLTMGSNERQNTFVECDPAGRSEADSDWVDIIQDVKQISSNPLLVLDGVTVTKMVVDSACVVKSGDPSKCVNQDILFLGTGNGKVMKVVFVTVSENGRQTTRPVFSEEIALENDKEEVRALRLETVGTDKKIFVSTDSQVYQLPIERCSRLQTCTACVGARDPYCVWNNSTNRCEKSTLSVQGSDEGTVPEDIWQDVHDGMVSGCMTVPECTVTATPLGSTQIECSAVCNAATASVTWSLSDDSLPSADCSPSRRRRLSDGQACALYTGTLGLHTYQCQLTAMASMGGSGPTYTASVTTEAGAPFPITTDEISVVCGRTVCEVCVQLGTFTDYFDNYNFTVTYGATMSLGTTTDIQNLNTGNCLNITSQTPGSTLYLQVTVTNSRGSTYSSILPHQLLEDVPGPVSGLGTSGKTSSTVSLLWNPPSVTNGVITGYAVMVNGTEEVSCVLLSDTTYTVDGLLPYTQYTFTVAACTRAGEGAPSTGITVRTNCDVPGPVDSISFMSPTSSSMTVEWTRPAEANGDSDELNYEYEYVCYDPLTGEMNTPSTQTTITTLSITNLKPLTSCCVTLRAYHGDSSSCSVTTRGPAIEDCARTLDVIPGQVRNFSLERISPTALFASWSPPANYERPGLLYTLTLSPDSGNGPITITDLTSRYLSRLDPSTNYSVTIFASASGKNGNGDAVSDTEMTGDRPPSPPENPSLSVSDTELMFSWSAPDTVTSYTVSLRCDDELFTRNTTTTSLSFDVSSVNGLAWCTAVVQARNSVGASDHSVQASVILNAPAPTKPKCFYSGNTGTNASISFTVTYPFSLNQLNLEWTLVTVNTSNSMNVSMDGTEDFSAADNNVVYVDVSRDRSYDFRLRLCANEVCGEYCDTIRFNTVSTVPFSPESISLMNSDCCSASIVWTLPPNEIEGQVSYTLQISSSCTREQGSSVISGLTLREYDFTDLCADTEYTVAVKATKLQTNTSSLYSRPFSFRTTQGTPSPPRNVVLKLTGQVGKIEDMAVTWGVPENPNGTIVSYEIHWSSSGPTFKCDKPDVMVSVFQVFVGAEITEYKTDNVSNLNKDPDLKALLVCVRARVEGGEGEWGYYQTADVSNTGGLSQPGTGGGGIETCTSLIIAAVIACLAVLSSIVLGVVLVLVICHNGWTPCRERKEKQAKDDLEKYANKHGNPRPPYNKSLSMQSTSSTAPMLVNGRNGSVS